MFRLPENSNARRTNNTAYITGNGVVIDTNGLDTYIGVHLDNAAGQTGFLTKMGTGTLSISGCGFTGPATILEGIVDFGSKGCFSGPELTIGEKGRLQAPGAFGHYMSSGDQLTLDIGLSGANGFIDASRIRHQWRRSGFRRWHRQF